jgi:hypothetical protein
MTNNDLRPALLVSLIAVVVVMTPLTAGATDPAQAAKGIIAGLTAAKANLSDLQHQLENDARHPQGSPASKAPRTNRALVRPQRALPVATVVEVAVKIVPDATKSAARASTADPHPYAPLL